MTDLLQQDLARGTAALGLDLPDGASDRLLRLMALLGKWNRAYNLTAITEPGEVLRKHVLDSLAAAPFVHGRRVLDVGTGGGFPGLPLAIIAPGREFVLLDSHAKKLRFIDHAAAELGLGNVATVHARAEQYRPAAPFDTVLCRALARLDRFLGWTAHLVADDGIALAMKGQKPTDELAALPTGWHAKARPVVVPLLSETRHIVELRRA